MLSWKYKSLPQFRLLDDNREGSEACGAGPLEEIKLATKNPSLNFYLDRTYTYVYWNVDSFFVNIEQSVCSFDLEKK